MHIEHNRFPFPLINVCFTKQSQLLIRNISSNFSMFLVRSYLLWSSRNTYLRKNSVSMDRVTTGACVFSLLYSCCFSSVTRSPGPWNVIEIDKFHSGITDTLFETASYHSKRTWRSLGNGRRSLRWHEMPTIVGSTAVLCDQVWSYYYICKWKMDRFVFAGVHTQVDSKRQVFIETSPRNRWHWFRKSVTASAIYRVSL